MTRVGVGATLVEIRLWRIAEVPSALGDFRTSLQSGLSALMAGAFGEFTPSTKSPQDQQANRIYYAATIGD